MTKGEFYYLLTVCGAFIVFGLGLGHGYLQYRRWLKDQPPATPQVEQAAQVEHRLHEVERKAA